MTITAKFASKCPVCRKGIDAGSRVEWNRGEKARHLGCEQVAPAAHVPTIFHYGEAGKPACGGQGAWVRSTSSVNCPKCDRILNHDHFDALRHPNGPCLMGCGLCANSEYSPYD